MLLAQGTTDALTLAETLADLSGPAVVLLVLLLLLRGDLVTKGQLNALEEDRDTWRDIAQEAIELGEAAIRRGLDGKDR